MNDIMNGLLQGFLFLLIGIVQFFSFIFPQNYQIPPSFVPGPRREIKLERFNSPEFNFYYPEGYKLDQNGDNYSYNSISAYDSHAADTYIYGELMMNQSLLKQNVFLTQEEVCTEEKRLATKNKRSETVLYVKYFETGNYRGCEVSVKHDANIFHGKDRFMKPDEWVISIQKTYWSKNPQDSVSYSFHANYREDNRYGNAQEIKAAYEKSGVN